MVPVVPKRRSTTQRIGGSVALLNLRMISLGADGINYVQACLRQGTGLCGKLPGLGLTEGEVSAAVPEGTSLKRARSFDFGGLMSRRDAIAWFTEHVTSLW